MTFTNGQCTTWATVCSMKMWDTDTCRNVDNLGYDYLGRWGSFSSTFM